MTLPGTKHPQRPPVSMWGLVEAGSVLLWLATAAGFLGRLWWVFELTTHFKVQLALLLSMTTVIWLIRKQWWLAGACALFGLANAGPVLAHLLPDSATPATRCRTMKLVGLNLHTSNRDSVRVLQFLKEANPDLLLLMEVNPRWMKELKSLHSDYPFALSRPRDDNFGIALFSRLPLRNGTILELGEAGVPSVSADVEAGGGTLHLLGTHPVPPGSSDFARLRNEQLLRIADHVRKQAVPVVLLGDLNVTPWSPYFRTLLIDADLKNAARGHGAMGSWPAGFPLMRIPLDHCLVTPPIQVHRWSLGPAVGSDHLPVVVELAQPAGGRDP